MEDILPVEFARQKVSIACNTCRTRKTRCDSKRPSCSFCRIAGVQCRYRDFRRISSSDKHRPAKGNKPPSNTASSSDTSPTAYLQPNLVGRSSAAELLATPLPAGSIAVSTPFFGFLSLSGLGRLDGGIAPAELSPLLYNDAEIFLTDEQTEGESMYNKATSKPNQGLDLTSATCWRLGQEYSNKVAPWLPLLDRDRCSELLTIGFQNNFADTILESGLALCIMALGSVAESEYQCGINLDHCPGLVYFHNARLVMQCHPAKKHSLLEVQFNLLASCYLLMCLKPLQAWQYLQQASLGVTMLMHLRSRLDSDVDFRESFYRAFWICYLIEHEFRGHLSDSAYALRTLADYVPYPTPKGSEPGWDGLLAGIAIRRIVSHTEDGIWWNNPTHRSPIVRMELDSQVVRWHSTLPASMRFLAEAHELLNPYQTFLKVQYHAYICCINWASVIELLSSPLASVDSRLAGLRVSAARSTEHATLFIFSAERLTINRHVYLFPLLLGVHCVAMLLLCTYGESTVRLSQNPLTITAIMKARSILARWSQKETVAKHLARLDALLSEKGLSPQTSNDTTSQY